MSEDERRVVHHDRKGKPDHHFYVLVLHVPTQRCFLMSRNYSLISNGNEHDIKFADQNAVQTWKGWKPSDKNQLPDWAKDLVEEGFTAFWMWNK